ncbi:asparaginase [Variovorax sp. DXTD-1]|uniref:asparaginase n=1 Tax=Variovorax sp. DXTD-1 TaxID=2495592 RepID=UPI000F874CD9|nr:asparaginase [Variovorax sp. DXTD-1]RST48074.1 asparaginase [Variovorax sp. DXTD-1]
MKRVVVLGTGGTIASRYSQSHGAVVSQDGGDMLLERVDTLPKGIRVEAEQFSNVGSYAISLEDAFRMAQRIKVILSQHDVAGVVVTHGTDTMEESAYLCDLFVRSAKPVVFTGAQRAADDPASDGLRNLADAIRVAAAAEMRGVGTVIAFEQEFHAARDATKEHSSRTGTFASAEHGKLGEIDGERVVLQRVPLRRGTIDTLRIDSRVDVVKMAMGVDERFIRCAVDAGARAIVLEGFGRGNTTPAVTEAARAAIRHGVTIAVTTRCPRGRVAPIYGAGGAADLADAGALFAGDLSAVKTRILLALLFGAGADREALRRAVELHGH